MISSTDRPMTKSFIEASDLSEKYFLLFSINYHDLDSVPKEIDCNLRGWEMRRELKKWADDKGYRDFVIFRNMSFQKDLHGPVYEMYLELNEYIELSLLARRSRA